MRKTQEQIYKNMARLARLTDREARYWILWMLCDKQRGIISQIARHDGVSRQCVSEAIQLAEKKVKKIR